MQEELNGEQRRVEEVLRKVRPVDSGIRRDGMMFAAGRASVGRGKRVWPWQMGMAAAVAVCVGMVVLRPGAVTIEKVVVVHDVAPSGMVAASEKPARMELRVPVEAEIEPGADYLAIRNAVLSRGVDALASPPTGGGGTGAAVERWKLEGSEALPAWERRSL